MGIRCLPAALGTCSMGPGGSKLARSPGMLVGVVKMLRSEDLIKEYRWPMKGDRLLRDLRLEFAVKTFARQRHATGSYFGPDI